MSAFLYRDDRNGRRFHVGWPPFRIVRPAAVEDEVARLVAERKIVGVFWGRSEFGPRALGNRSILADPRWDGMRDYLNERVKHRQWFRPYAPVVLEEKCAEWFELDHPSPHMLLVAKVREEKRERIPAVTHVDGTARVQTVAKDAPVRLRRVVEAFERLTGVPVLLNTSFNDHGEPIVETPLDAFQCFASTDLDALAFADAILLKELS
ncbi:MAG: hypothetical protein M5R36_28435 [Deltaproteobacteria bacterium]|nr:hypothetical protein [Deltaproteobacteria bacterium]